MMYVQPEHVKINDAFDERLALSFPNKSELKDMCLSEHRIVPCKTFHGGEPEVCYEIDIKQSDTLEQRKRFFTHSLARVMDDGTCNEAVSQLIGIFGGFCAGIRASGVKSKPYYFLTFQKPPYESALNTVLEKRAAAANLKCMAFIQVIGDKPFYALMVQLKYENPANSSSWRLSCSDVSHYSYQQENKGVWDCRFSCRRRCHCRGLC